MILKQQEQFWWMKTAPCSNLFAAEMRFSNISFQIGSIAQKENQETVEFIKSFKTLNFLFQALKDPTYTCQNSNLNSLIYNKNQITTLAHKLCFLLTDRISDQV